MPLKNKHNSLLKKGFQKLSTEIGLDGNFVPIEGTIGVTRGPEIGSVTSITVSPGGGASRNIAILGTGFDILPFQTVIEISGVNEAEYNNQRFEVEPGATSTIINVGKSGVFTGVLTGNPVIRVLNPIATIGAASAVTTSGTQNAGLITVNSGSWVTERFEVGKRFQLVHNPSNTNADNCEFIGTITGWTTTTLSFIADRPFTPTVSASIATGISEIGLELEDAINFREHPDEMPNFGDYSAVDNHMLEEVRDSAIPIVGTLTIDGATYPLAYWADDDFGNPPTVYFEAPGISTQAPLVGKVITISGLAANRDGYEGDYTITTDNVFGDPDAVYAIKNAIKSGGSAYSYGYSGSASYVITTNKPVTGNVQFSAQPDTLPGFNAFSTITEGRAQALIPGQATETVAGIAEIATQAETDAGVDDTRFVTPAKLAAYPRTLDNVVEDGGTTARDIEITDSTRGIILTAPNASRWRVTVDDTGNLITTSI